MLPFHARGVRLLNPLQCLRFRPLASRLPSIPISLQCKVRFASSSNEPINANIFTVPNLLTMSRIACTPLIGYYIMLNELTPAMSLFAYSCVTDYLDGFIARKWKLKSVAGTILDPIADKLLMIVTTVSLAFAPGPQIIPLSIAGIILGRDMLLGISALFIRLASMKRKYGKVTWNSYWDFFHFPSVEVKPTQVSKYNTFFQMMYLGYGVLLLIMGELTKKSDKQEEQTAGNDAHKILREGFNWMGYLVGTTTCLSGVSYALSKSALRFL
ncbi:hypothetical protein ZYGR_0AS02520 [Zygosaccharomyces rouxii]|uniref:Cardiolipin synthase n=1 Tax=Zygosaccharomyces rouxii TaxID=4956 RepID=A0A1Q3AGN2_ZYGRO|nr:hypothetical protein ZYGR_0AS02520 [Zygosaccharomyces rouxii]